MEPKLELHRATAADSRMLSLLASACFLEAFADDLDRADLLAFCEKNYAPAEWERYLAKPTARIDTVGVGDVPVGYVLTCEPELPAEYLLPGDYELKRIYLLHRFHGGGAGRMLMERGLQTAKELGRKRLLLGVFSENTAAVAFYRHVGFEQIGTRMFQVGAAEHLDFVMAYVL